jgi:transposase
VFASEQNEGFRNAFLNEIAPLLNSIAMMKFIDETSFNTAMARRYARAHKSERAVDRLPRNQGKNQTLICALQLCGPAAAFVFDGSVNGDAFVWYVEHILCPTLKPGEIVFLDNLSAHHRDEVADLIEERGCSLIYFPPYSPDFNPIEMLFSKIKALVRAGRWRDLPSLWSAIGKALLAVTAQDILGWFRAAYPTALL